MTKLLMRRNKIHINSIFVFLEQFYFILFYKNNFTLPINSFNFNIIDSLYIYQKKINILSFNLYKLYYRWTNTYWLLFNIIYYNNKYLLFATPDYKNEIFALNWFHLKCSWELWKYFSYWFLLKINRYNKQTRLFFNQLKKININIIIIINVFYHFKLVNLFKKFHFNTIGLLPIQVIPNFFLISIIIFDLNFFIQFYFLYFLLYLKRLVFDIKHVLYFKFWLFMKIKSIKLLNLS